jgi:hypothetical protein
MRDSSSDIKDDEEKTEATPRETNRGGINRRELFLIGGVSAAMLGVRAACRKLGLGKNEETGGRKTEETEDGSDMPKDTAELATGPEIRLSETQKKLLQEHPDAILDEETGNVLIGKNKKIMGKKIERANVDGIDFNIRRKADIDPGEQLVEITLGGKTKKFRKSFADLLLKVEEEMKSDYIKYKSGEGGLIWRSRYEIRMKILGANGSTDHIAAADSFRTNDEQENAYKKSLTGETDGGRPVQSFKAAPPGMSFHETGYAVDVDNWREAQYYMWKYGITGGSRGIDEDPRHFSIREFNNKWLIRAGKNRAWSWYKKHTK